MVEKIIKIIAVFVVAAIAYVALKWIVAGVMALLGFAGATAVMLIIAGLILVAVVFALMRIFGVSI